MFSHVQTKVWVQLISLLAVSCLPESRNNRARPSDDFEEIPGYLTESSIVVFAGNAGEISIGDADLSILQGSSTRDLLVTLRRSPNKHFNSISEILKLGSSLGDVIEVEIVDASSLQSISQEEILLPMTYRQIVVKPSAVERLFAVVTESPGLENEVKTILDHTQLGTEEPGGRPPISEDFGQMQRVFFSFTTANSIIAIIDAANSGHDTVGDSHNSINGDGGSDSLGTESVDTGTPTGTTISIQGGTLYTTSTSVTLNLSAIHAAEMYVTNSPGCAVGGSWESFTTSKNWTIGQSNSIATVYAVFRHANGNVSSCLSHTIVHDNTNPSGPSNVNDGSSMLVTTESPIITWNAGSDSGSGISHYEVAIGSTQGSSNIVGWTNVGNVTSKKFTGLTLSAGSNYFASVRAVDYAGLVSTVGQGDGWLVLMPPFSGLVTAPTAYWAMNEASGTRFDGVGSFHLNDTFVGSAAGKLGNGGVFESSNSEYLYFPHDTQLTPNGVFSIQAWVYFTELSVDRWIFGKWSVANGYEYGLYYNAGGSGFSFVKNGSDGLKFTSWTPAGGVLTNSWYCLHAWFDGSKIFVTGNAEAVGSGTTTATNVTGGNSPLVVGANEEGTVDFAEGIIDEVGFWNNHVLSSQERQELYNGGNGLAF